MKTLKDAIYEVAHRSKKPLKDLAEEIDMSPNYLTRAALPDLEESETGTASGCNFPLKKVAPITLASGNFAILDHLESRVGRVGILLPTNNGSLSDICKLSLKSVEEFGHLMSEVTKSLDDNTIQPDELSRIQKECYHAQQAMAALTAALEKKTTKGK